MKALAAALIVVALPVQAATLTVKVQGVTGDGGVLKLGLCDADSFAGKPDHGIITNAKPGEMVLTFRDLAPGEYAANALQDINLNDRLDRNVLGIPTEPYGFSNNPLILFSAPSYADAKFTVNEGDNAIVIRLK